MDSGRCRRCGRPFTAGEVTGFGILRARPAAQGGPVVEFPCPGCRTTNRLVPHGNGRYAPPGAPPPPPPPEHERRVPWKRGTHEPVGPVPTSAPPDAATPAAGPAASGGPPRPPRAPDPEPGPTADEAPIDASPMDLATAAGLLGVAPEATPAEIERTFRERALLCHPDKVAHLDPEFVALAERKFRRLQDARDLLLLRAARDLLSGSP